MKSVKQIIQLVTMLILVSTNAQLSGGGEANPDLHTNQEALENFKDMRFGMFIHWGPVTLRGTEIGWSRGKDVPIEDYDQLYKEFNPVLFNAEEWVKTAKEAGMKYIILTARHHDGFALWHSEFSEYDMEATPYGKDIVRALSDECKKQGILFGTYFSICDWRNPDYPVVYPAPDYSFNEEREMDKPTKERMDRFITYNNNQLREVIENYNPEIIWFDGEWEWAWTHEMGMDLYKYVRGLNDNILINNRVDKGRDGMAGITKSTIYAGDFATPEQQVGNFDNVNPWETCMTIAEQWAWKPNDKLKSKKECIQTLLQTVGGDGNLLFNVGPMADGRIEKRQIERLREMGEWLSTNGEAVYGTSGGPYLPTEKMVSTRNKNKIYLHLFEHPGKDFKLPFPKGIKISKASFLQGGTNVKVSQKGELAHFVLPETLPDNVASVIVLELSNSAMEIELMQRFNY